MSMEQKSQVLRQEKHCILGHSVVLYLIHRYKTSGAKDKKDRERDCINFCSIKRLQSSSFLTKMIQLKRLPLQGLKHNVAFVAFIFKLIIEK